MSAPRLSVRERDMVRSIVKVIAEHARDRSLHRERSDSTMRSLGRVLARVARTATVLCGHCGGRRTLDRSCDCFDNGCQ